ncbi:DUF3788 family protein [candidate division KSB1 bacterium]
MAWSIFTEKTETPDEKKLLSALGDKGDLWKEIIGFINDEYDNIREEWKFYGAKYGWQLKVFYKKRNILFMLPNNNDFMIAFVLSDKAVAAVEESSLPEELKNALRNEKKYMEGRGARIEVKTKDDVEIVKSLVKIKLDS